MKQRPDYLDVRESGGYERAHIEVVRIADDINRIAMSVRSETRTTFGHPCQNGHIQASNGPSGANIDYLLALYEALESWKIEDSHIRQLVAEIRQNSAC